MPSPLQPVAYTRPGPIRAGNDYQDIVAVGYLLDWMEQPEALRSVELEAEESGCLDDVKVTYADGTIELVQVKFSVNPDSTDDAWGWDELLKQRRSKKQGQKLPSLLERWVASWKNVSANQQHVRVKIASNRRSRGSLHQCLRKKHVQWDQVDDESRGKLRAHISEEDVRAFLEICEFSLGQGGLDEYAEAQRERFTGLRGTAHGWLSLKEAVRRWAIDKNKPMLGGRVSLRDILDAALWAIPRPVDQRFAIPPDFLEPDDTFVEGLIGRLTNEATPCCFLAGFPASGKSTFTSWLFDRLEKQGHPILRHHYFLSVSDHTQRRLEYQVAAESLMSDLLHSHRGALGVRASENPNPLNLADWLEAAGAFYYSRGQRLILIIDGLDHVWREHRTVEQLSRLLDMILPTPTGVGLLLVSQPVSDDQLPAVLGTYAPREGWIYMPRLGEGQVEQWLEHHASELPSAYQNKDNTYRREQLVRSLLSHCEGQPLHLRYSWNYLVQHRIPISPDEIGKLPKCPQGDIRNYYRQLWTGLPTSGRICLMLLALCEWPWPTGGLVEVLLSAKQSANDAQDGFEAIKHLLKASRLGMVPYHQSLATSVREQQATVSFRQPLLQAASEWLRITAPEYWRWAHEWELSVLLGDSTPLVDGPSREWTVRSLTDFRPTVERNRILERAAWEAAKRRLWPRVVAFGTWLEYSARPTNSPDGSLEEALEARLLIADDNFLLLQLLDYVDRLPDAFLPILGRFVNRAELTDELPILLDNLRCRYKGAEETPGFGGHRFSGIDLVGHQLVSHLAPEVFSRWLDRHIQSTDHDALLEALPEIARGCRASGSLRHLRLLAERISDVPQTLRKQMIKAIARWITRISLDAGVGVDLATDDIAWMDPMGALTYADANDRKWTSFTCLAPALSLLDRRQSLENRRIDSAEVISDFFWWAIGSKKLGGIDRVVNAVDRANLCPWTSALLRQFISISTNLAPLLPQNPQAAIRAFVEELMNMSVPDASVDDDYTTTRGARRALVLIVHDMFCLARLATPKFRLAAETVKELLDLRFAWADSTLAALSQIQGHWLDNNACEALNHWMSGEFEEIDHYPSRATRAAMGALVLARNDCKHQARHWLHLWAENVLAHGDHKDMPLVEAVDCVELLIQQKSLPQERNLQRLLNLANAVSCVMEFTDGKETKAIPSAFLRSLAEVDPPLTWLRRYHRWLFTEQEYYRMEQAFTVFIQNADLTHPANRVASGTAISDDDIQILRERKQRNDPFADETLAMVEAVVGKACELETAEAERGKDDDNGIIAERDKRLKAAFANLDMWPPSKLAQMVASNEHNLYDTELGQLISEWYDRWKGTSPNELLLALSEAKLAEPDLQIGHALWLISRRAPDIVDRIEALAVWMRDVSGWTRYFNEHRKAESVMSCVANSCPDKVHDFILASMSRQDRGESNRLSVNCFSWYRLVELFVKVGDIHQAESIVDQIVATVKELCEVQPLPPVNWTVAGDPDFGNPWLFAVDLLSTPQLIRRERAATAIGGALAAYDAEAQQALKDWLFFQRVPTLAMHGLLPLVKAKELGRAWNPTELRVFYDSITAKSIGSWIVACVLDGNVAGRMDAWASFKTRDPLPNENEGDSFLGECSYFVPRGFRDVVSSLPHPFATLFAGIWHEEFEIIWGQKPDRRVDPGLRTWWRVGSGNRRHIGAQSWINEACRSGFDRAVARMVRLQLMAEDHAVSWCRRNIPIDLELWKIPPTSRPAWWPYVAQIEKEGVVEVPESLWKSIDGWFANNAPSVSSTDWIIGGLKGCVDAGAIRFGIDIRSAIQQRVEGPRPDDADIVHAAYGEVQGVWRQKIQRSGDQIHCKGALRRLTIADCAVKVGGWAVLPMTSMLQPGVVTFLQPWRLFNLPRTVLPWFTSNPCYVEAENHELVTKTRGHVIARWSDWTAGIEEWLDFEAGINRAGDQILLKRRWLQSLITEWNGNWIWAVTITAHIYDRYGREEKKVEFHRVLGGSEIIHSD